MATKPSIPKGTRDFTPAETARRNYIFDIIREAFHIFGYQQIETPAMENLSTLMGKYGEEGDKLLFKILNSGDFLKKTGKQDFEEPNLNHLTNLMCEKGLRYDLTVPFARFVVMNRNNISLPFKRYQIQPVWRADRPQKGRYREFYQCDADVVGSPSLNNEIELISLLDFVFGKLNIPVIIKLNNRKILSGIAEYIGFPEKLTDITVAIDKIDKIGLEKVNEELKERGLSDEALKLLQPMLTLSGSNEDKLANLREILKDSETGVKGIEEMESVISGCKILDLDSEIEIDFSLARGLNYYTGTIIEVKAKDYEIGSIAGGGRYDNLTGVFGMDDLTGVGVSFGADRIYDVMTGNNLFPENVDDSVTVLFLNFGKKESDLSLDLVNKLRNKGISSELYPDMAKIKKQMNYANAIRARFVAIIGEEEAKNREIVIKEMSSGKQETIKQSEILDYQW